MLKFLDCNCQVGRYSAPQPEAVKLTEPAGLVEELNYNGISGALVYHALAKELSPSVGNSRLLREIVGQPLYPCWAVMPHYTGEMAEPRKLVDTMISRGVRAARLFPATQQFKLSEWCCGELFAELERRKVPVFVELDQTGGWDEIAGILAAHPKLRLTVLRPNYRNDRYLYPLFERYPHFSIEISFYQVTSGIQTVCRRFGAERLLFGTGLPWYNAGVPISMVTYAEISDEEKQLIAGGNLRRLMREVEE